MKTKHLSIFAAFMLFVSPMTASAGVFEVSGWIPYWRSATGTADVLPHLNLLTEVNPFVYTLRSDGTFLDNGQMDQEPWLSFIAAAKAQKVRVIPTIMTGNGDLIHELLSNTKSRIALEDYIAKFVKDNNFDGIDIDFEGKRAEDKDYFSTFLKGLYMRMGNKWVMCTIESRTPLDSRYYGAEIPADAEIYANDFKEINKYCDRVRIMAYDQQGIDQRLASNAEGLGQLYAPVADPAWVAKVVNMAKKDIKASKIMIGVPTYGYEYSVTAYAGNQYIYDILWTFNPGYATQISKQFGVTPSRSPWGEMHLAHMKDSGSTTPVSAGAYQALAAAFASSAYAQNTNSHIDFRYLVWPDAQSIADKVKLAKDLGVRGISIFKLDGGQDPGIWSVLQGVKK